MIKWDLFQESKYSNINVIHHRVSVIHNRIKEKLYDHLNRCKKNFDKIQHPCMND